MKQGPLRPKWWILYLLIVLILGLFWLQAKAPLSEAVHTWLEVGLILLLYGSMMAWLKANEYALWMEEREKNRKRGIPKAPEPFQLMAGRKGNILESQNGNGRPHEAGHRLEGRILPAWLISLSAIIVDFFRTPDD